MTSLETAYEGQNESSLSVNFRLNTCAADVSTLINSRKTASFEHRGAELWGRWAIITASGPRFIANDAGLRP
jgi:hypothetical protein